MYKIRIKRKKICSWTNEVCIKIYKIFIAMMMLCINMNTIGMVMKPKWKRFVLNWRNFVIKRIGVVLEGMKCTKLHKGRIFLNKNCLNWRRFYIKLDTIYIEINMMCLKLNKICIHMNKVCTNMNKICMGMIKISLKTNKIAIAMNKICIRMNRLRIKLKCMYSTE